MPIPGLPLTSFVIGFPASIDTLGHLKRMSDLGELQKRHREEQKDLQARIAQKKKSATKKTRKGVNDECTDLERALREKQDAELFQFNDFPSSEPDLKDDIPVDNSRAPKLEDLTEHIESPMQSLSISPAPSVHHQSKKPNRQKARLARRAAEQEALAAEATKEAQDLPNLREQEREKMQKSYTLQGLKELEIRSDGHCLYAAIADQLTHSGRGYAPQNLQGTSNIENAGMPGFKKVRHVAASYIMEHADDFVPFLEEPLEQYTNTIRDTGEWGGHLELMALAKAYGVDINILQGDGRVEKIESGSEDQSQSMWLAYYRHSFGLGEHYNSLRR